ncbi:unnamed protein product [Amoebophrya sp. A25]|nr:unnamed protein product [Amoebophrya sp. A25]|eukprot:GSA25T00011358001.1
MVQSHYLILGVPRTATQEVVKKAYRELAKKYHPDRNAGKAATMFQKVQEAYTVLGDEGKRRDYDSSMGVTSSSSSSRNRDTNSVDPDVNEKVNPMAGSWMDPQAPRNRNPNVELAKKLQQKREHYERHGSGRYANPHSAGANPGAYAFADAESLRDLSFAQQVERLWTSTLVCRQVLLMVPFFVIPVGLLGFVFCTCIDHSMTGLGKKKTKKGKIIYDEEGKAYCRDAQGSYRKLPSALDITD